MSPHPLKKLFQIYLESDGNDELEVKFFTRKQKKISRIEFDNVIHMLKSKGFTIERPTGVYLLRMQNEFMDRKSGNVRMSNIRTEISSLSNIKNYCKKNGFPFENPPAYTNFYQKRAKIVDGNRVTPVNYDDFDFRVDLKEENPFKKNNIIITSMLKKWTQSKKNFRFIKRFTFRHKDFPLKVDCSIVKNSHSHHGQFIPAYNIQEAGVFTNPENYEVEIEMDSQKILKSTNDNIDTLIGKMKKVVLFILGAIQQTNFPIGVAEQKKTLDSYLKLINKKIKSEVRPSDFIGPSSISLEMSNITPINPESKAANIRTPYTVTEKADGQRKLLYIAPKGKIYLLNTNMKVQFTGCKSNNPRIYDSLLDGEHVLHDKMGKFINLYLVFDIYFLQKEDLRALPFLSTATLNYPKTRLAEVNRLLEGLDMVSITGKDTPALSIEAKNFYKAEGSGIFKSCKKILDNIEDGIFRYETDGLIFTPIDKGVGSDTLGKKPPSRKITWRFSLKWKPPAFNTVDFLVSTVKNPTGQDFIGNIFENGENMGATRQIPQYKQLTLRVGYDASKHGYLNPCQDVIDGKYPSRRSYEKNNYKPMPFYPTTPSDPDASISNVLIKIDNYGSHYMFTENQKEVFEDNTIVEFRYDPTKEKYWRWIPIRVRHDKTSELRRGLKNYGNAFHVADSVWHSIHYPITTEMLKTGNGIPDILGEDDIYYKRAGGTITRSMRDFHNLYVKRRLIEGVAKPGETLIDLAVGKAGDMSKWIAGHLRFVFGIDISRDNIENRKDGACARYLNYKKRFNTLPAALFIEGSSALNLRNGDAAANTGGKKILDAIFGKGPKDEGKLGSAVYKQYGTGKDGFNIVSCQFALHYFFENQTILQNFLRNISENCKVGGHFIGTCYDGATVFAALENKETGESLVAYKDDKKMWEITKDYTSSQFEDNETSIGYPINVYQESINKVFKEYLVNFTYLQYLLENYGFQLVTREEARAMGLPSATGLFSELFTSMEQDIAQHLLRKADVGTAENMSTQEKQVSFYNRFFVFKKIRHIDASKILRVLTSQGAASPDKPVRVSKGESKRKPIKKLNRRININTIS